MEPEAQRTILSRRALLGAGWTAAGLGAAAAMWPRTPRSRVNIPPGRTVIDYWEKWTGPEGESIQRVVDQFNASQAKIFVRRTPVSEIDTKAVVAIGGGDPPDVCGVFSYNVPQYAQSGAAIPLEEFGGIDPQAYIPSVRDLLSFRGKLIAGVTSIYTLALYYNKAIFRQAGLDPEAPPSTVQELESVAQRLTRTGSAGQIELAGFLPNLPTWWPYTWPILFGSTLYDAAANRSTFDRPECTRAYQWVRSFPARLGAQQSRAFGTAVDRSYHSEQDPFISGRVAMIAQGPWLANFINRYHPTLDYAAAPLPVDVALLEPGRPLGMVEADVLIIPRGAKNPEAAFEFVKYTQTQHVQEQLAREHTKSSPLLACSEAFRTGHPNKYVHVHDEIARSPRVSILPQTTVWKSYAHLTEGVFDAAWKGDDVEALCQQTHARVQAMLDRDAMLRERRGGGAGTGEAKRMNRRVRELLVGLAWVSPWLIGCIVFLLWPMAMSIYYSLTDYALVDSPVFVGLDNYKELLGDRLLLVAMRNTGLYALMAVTLSTCVSVLIAVLLEQKLRGATLVRSLVFLPTLVPVVANCVVWLWLLNPGYGLVNAVLLAAVGISGPNWLGERSTALPTMVVMGVWVIGSPLLVCAAALKEVPTALYEAAKIDGMGAIRRFVHVTLPMISPALLFNGIMSVIWSLQVLAPPMIMTRGGPDNATLTYSMYVYKTAFEFGRMGYASALAWVQILITLLLAGVVVVLSKRVVHYRGA